MKQSDNWRVCVIFAPQPPSVGGIHIATVNLLHALEALCKEIFVITGTLPENALGSERIHIINIKHKENAQSPMLVRVPRFIILQLKMSYHLFKIASNIDVVFLAAGASTLFLPALLAKLLRKRVISLRPGTDSLQKLAKLTYQETLFGIGKHVFVPIIGVLERLGYFLSDKIVVFRSDFTTPALKRYLNKLSFSGSHFSVDINSLRVKRNLDSRENLVGYIGRFVEAGGVMNFVKAIPQILKESAEVKVLIGGDGPLREEIKKEIKDAKLGDKVTLTGWIPHDRIARYLNTIKLLVIPSYQEAGPQILFEAMACGTPVLAAPVGVMPDVIKDGENGFIMEDNSPQCIARNTIRAFNHPNLIQIAKAARELMEREYTREAAVERYRGILASLK